MTMPWTPNTCPNTLALRMPCPSPLFRSLCKTKTTAEHGMSHQHRWSDTHYNVTRAYRRTVRGGVPVLPVAVDHRDAEGELVRGWRSRIVTVVTTWALTPSWMSPGCGIPRAARGLRAR